MSKTLILKPRLSEKSYALSESRVYVVEIDKSVNKHSVARAVSEQFEVEVQAVRIANIQGKRKQTRSLTGKRYSNSKGRRNDIKKAYVTLKEGYSLPFFAAVEEQEAQEKASQEEFDKAIAKQNAKEDKSKTKRFINRSKNAKEDEEKK
jgi:large subunit ribosomal protein L23